LFDKQPGQPSGAAGQIQDAASGRDVTHGIRNAMLLATLAPMIGAEAGRIVGRDLGCGKAFDGLPV
jgi:hypothetical protein